MSLDPDIDLAEAIAEGEMVKRIGDNWREVTGVLWAYDMVRDVATAMLKVNEDQVQNVHAQYRNRPNNWN